MKICYDALAYDNDRISSFSFILRHQYYRLYSTLAFLEDVSYQVKVYQLPRHLIRPIMINIGCTHCLYVGWNVKEKK